MTKETIESFIDLVWLPTLGAVIGVLTPYLKGWITDKLKSNKIVKGKNRFLDGLIAIIHAYDLLKSLLDFEEIDRVFLLKLTNGGSTPKVGSELFVHSIKVWANEDGEAKEIESKYEGVRVDTEYVKMAITLASGGDYIMDVETAAYCLLKEFYMGEDIKISQVYHMYTDPKSDAMYLVSTASKNSNMKGKFLSHSSDTARWLIMEKTRRIFELNDRI